MMNYPEQITLQPLTQPPDATIFAPGSKSITNRALILASLASGQSTLCGALDSEDTQVMIGALQSLGLEVRFEKQNDTLQVMGQGGHLPATKADLYLGNSGTSTRFLTALTSLGSGDFRLDGVSRMRERPIGDLLNALRALGADAVSEAGNDCPPIRVHGAGRLPGGKTRLRAEASSQFLTALLMIAPYAERDVEIEIVGSLRPFYVEITLRMMAQWGVDVEVEGTSFFRVRSGQRYLSQPGYQIEPDASGASYLFAAAAITGGKVRVPHLAPDALQGDVRFATEVLAEMGCSVEYDAAGLIVSGPPEGGLKGIDRDMSAISDTSLTLAAIAPFADSPTTVRNIAHTRLQECDRIHAACTELTRLGVQVEEHADGFTVYPAKRIKPGEVRTYHDHRVAMSFALIGLRAPGVTILDPGCVAKTFPDYWQRLEQLHRS